MTTPEQYIDALHEERDALKRAGKTARVKDVDVEIARWEKIAEDGTDPVKDIVGAAQAKQTEAAIAAEAARLREISNAEAQRHREANAAAAAGLAPAAGVQRPALTAPTEEWREFAKAIDLGTPTDAGHADIIAAYVEKHAPAWDAGTEEWADYVNRHGIEPGTQDRDELRAAAVEAGWARDPEDRAPDAAPPGPKRTTADATPRAKRTT